MKIWVDADACPGAVKDIVITAANKRSVSTIFVANKTLSLPNTPYLSLIQVEKSPDAADFYIKEHAELADLVITQDILLAHNLVAMGIAVINPRGKKFTEENIGEIVATHNLMEGLRDGGAITGGPKQFGDKEKRAFAATFDQELNRLLRKTRQV
jgi:uncharacterized protein